MKRALPVLLFFITSLSAWSQFSNGDCLLCHGDKQLEAVTPRGQNLMLWVDPAIIQNSAHSSLSCTACHLDADSFDEIPHTKSAMRYGCRDCHSSISDLFSKQDIHGKAAANGNTMAPDCQHCHGGHDIPPVTPSFSPMSRKRQADTCGKCHGHEDINLQEGITKRNLISRFKSSVHWLALEAGKNAATCSDCHGHHTILPSSDYNSTVSKTGILNVCIRCHEAEVKSFRNGPHGHALQHGNHDVPTCTTCHGDHDMTSLRLRSGDAKQWASTQVCIWCHNNKNMMARYGLDTTPVDSYMRDFHGLTQRGTMGASATCADCHDAHNSLPSSHPQSRMFITNRGSTCGTCHGQVSDSFALSFSHKKALAHPGRTLENLVRIFYILLIVSSVVGMLTYNLIIWGWAVRRKVSEQKKQDHLKRMNRFEIINHLILFLTFTLLAISGFALKFPDSFWVKALFALGMTESVRALIHRMASITMVCNMTILMLYMLLNLKGRRILKALIPRWRDFSDAWKSVRFYLGKKMPKPLYPWYNFAEKFEFWALVWGIIIMTVTGLILWFPALVPNLWPPWIHNVARIIHYYEAILATLSIFIWHGFQTIWHPEEYPMNTSWLTGRITAAEAKERFEETAIISNQGPVPPDSKN